MTPIASLLVSAMDLFNENGNPSPTPFTEIYGMSNGQGFYIQYDVSDEHVVTHNLGGLKTLFSHWYTD